MRQKVDLPDGAEAVITLTGTVDDSFKKGSVKCTSEIKSAGRDNSGEPRSGAITTRAKATNSPQGQAGKRLGGRGHHVLIHPYPPSGAGDRLA